MANERNDILFLLMGFGVGTYLRGHRAKSEKVQAEQQAGLLNQQVSLLRQKIASMERAEEKRLQAAARRRQYIEENDIADPENQIRFISQCDLRAVPPVNREAVRVLYTVEDWIRANLPKWRLSFEVGMGAFIKTSDALDDELQKAAFSSYNSKRVDFLLIDSSRKPKLAIEYNGTGHDLSEDASARMEVKRLALQRADIPLIEIPERADKQEILSMVTAAVGQSQSSG